MLCVCVVGVDKSILWVGGYFLWWGGGVWKYILVGWEVRGHILWVGKSGWRFILSEWG